MIKFTLGETKCDRCGKQMRPKRNFYRITFGLYGNEHPESSIEALYDFCPNCYKEMCNMFNDWMGLKENKYD